MADTGSKKRSSHWNWLLLLPGIGLLFPAVYARQSPTLFGFPFFYWYQFAWVFLTAAITAVVYVLVKDETSDPPPQNSGQQT
jgi:dolichyl-phosphate-mannose--protein O-mannosyl transferase